jgi:O-antigen ligase
MAMKKEKARSIYDIIILFSFLITLSISPWVSKDSMIIPKLIILFVIALYLLPKIIYALPDILQFSKLKVLVGIITLIMIQIIIVTIVSSAPFEQQLFGRTGRGLGIVTSVSLLLVVLGSAIFVRVDKLNMLLIGLVSSCLITSTYALFQSFGIDFLRWTSRTNGVIGTLGNPNFQSSFAALALIPTLVLFSKVKFKYYGSIFFGSLLLWIIVRTQSTQGYVSAFLAVSIFAIIFCWYRNKSISIILITLTFFSGMVAILSMLNKGPLSTYFYKVSVQSRGDFWRSAFAASNDHPFFGVGMDSFGDSYLKYRDEIAISHPWAEYTDNAHNFFLEYAVTAGYPMVVLQVSLILLALISYIQAQRRISYFDKDLTAIFTAWVVFQAQSFISPGNISMMTWNAVLTGTLIGVSELNSRSVIDLVPARKQILMKTRISSYSFVFLALLISYPLFNTDRQQMQAMNMGDGDLAISSTKRYPESVLRYQVITRELLNSNLPVQALDLARSAVEFNPNSANLWALVLINPSASIEERVKAKAEIIKLDPLNKEVINYEIK